MSNSTFDRLHAEGHISAGSVQRVKDEQSNRLFSLYWETRLLLYLGVLLLTGGLGILVYKNIDTIGHQAVLAFIALVSVGCFGYCWKKRAPFSWSVVRQQEPLFDYILLLGCLSLLIFLGYWQYAYEIFGNRYGLATFIPMVILFFTAYIFDHQGVLGLAITNLAAWAGVTVTPLNPFYEGGFATPHLISTGIALGIFLMLAGHVSRLRVLKAHFWITYTNFGFHLFFIAALAGLFTFDAIYGWWFLGMAAVAAGLFMRALALRSFYFIMAIILYMYIALSDVAMRAIFDTRFGGDEVTMALFYFIFTPIGIGVLLVKLNRKLKSHDSL